MGQEPLKLMQQFEVRSNGNQVAIPKTQRKEDPEEEEEVTAMKAGSVDASGDIDIKQQASRTTEDHPEVEGPSGSTKQKARITEKGKKKGNLTKVSKADETADADSDEVKEDDAPEAGELE